jgi:hypothetical protein
MSSDVTTANTTTDRTGHDPLAVCTLPADGLGERLAWIRSEILPHAVSSVSGTDGIVWELEDAPGLAARLDELIVLERECCSGIEFAHAAGAAAGRRRFEVRGIDPGASVFTSLKPGPRESAGAGGRVAKAAGWGAIVGLFVCCVVPIAVAAAFGAAVAAPFALLDDPWIIAGVALASGSAMFAWRGRSQRLASCNPEC